MGRKTVDQPQGSTERVRRFRKRRALIDTFTTLAYSTSDNVALNALQDAVEALTKEHNQDEKNLVSE